MLGFLVEGHILSILFSCRLIVMNSRTGKVILLLRVSRPAGWIFGPLVFFHGLVISPATHLNLLTLIQLIILSFPASLITYGINDVFDYETDRINPRKHVKGIIEGIVLDPKHHSFVLKSAHLFSFIILITALFTRNFLNILGIGSSLILVYAYSMPPIRLKERPPLDSICIGVIVFCVFVAGFSYNKTVYDLALHKCVPEISFISFHAFTTIMDYSSDKATNVRTFAVVFGKRCTALFSFILNVLLLMLVSHSFIIWFLLVGIFSYFLLIIFPQERLAHFLFYFIGINDLVIFAVWIALWIAQKFS